MGEHDFLVKALGTPVAHSLLLRTDQIIAGVRSTSRMAHLPTRANGTGRELARSPKRLEAPASTTVYTDAIRSRGLRLSSFHSSKQRTWNWIGFTPLAFLVVAPITSCSAAMTVPHAAQTSPAARLPDTFDTLSYGSRPLCSTRMRRRTVLVHV